MKLNPCPFCGGEVTFHGNPSDENCHGCHNIYCETCGLFDLVPEQHSGTLEEIRAVAAEKWNKRAIHTGYVVEPTMAMRIAAGDISDGFEGLCADNVLAIYKAMLAAAKEEV